MFIWPEPNNHFTPGVVKTGEDASHEKMYFVFRGPDIFQSFDASGHWQPLSQLPGENVLSDHYLGSFAEVDCYAVEVAADSDGDFANLRSLFGKTDNFMFSLAGRATQVLDWYRTHQYCGKCGEKTVVHEKDRATYCDACSAIYYPRLSPSIITLVHRGDELLLARNHRFPPGMYSTLAGFVEPGESIEDTLRREVKEEVGVSVGALEYLGSQPWPFPNSLMLGFLAEYESGDFVLQEDEIEDAQWFHYENLPHMPGPVAISRWIIDTYLARLGVKVSY
jgi:NAD+ diphosphatase